MQIEVVTADGKKIEAPFLLRIMGWTEERYFEEAPEDQIWEFEDGEIIIHSPVSPRHQRGVGFLTFLLRGYVEEKELGEVFNGPAVLRLREGVDKEPDIFWVSKDHRESIKTMYIEGPADMVIEVSSPVTRSYDLEEKSLVYRECGVKEYWVVDQERRRIIIFSVEKMEVKDEGRIYSEAIAGFWIKAEWLWQELMPGALSCLREIISD